MPALPAAASATDYCVKPKATCGVNNLDTLEVALDEAAKQPNQDRILLGAHEYEASNPSGYSYLNARAHRWRSSARAPA